MDEFTPIRSETDFSHAQVRAFQSFHMRAGHVALPAFALVFLFVFLQSFRWNLGPVFRITAGVLAACYLVLWLQSYGLFYTRRKHEKTTLCPRGVVYTFLRHSVEQQIVQGPEDANGVRGITELPYGKLHKVRRHKDMLYLYISRRVAWIADLAMLSEADRARLTELLKSETGKRYRGKDR